MGRVISVCVFLFFLATGCGQSTSPPSYAKYDLGGGRYFVEIENTDGGSSLKFHSRGEGKFVTEEVYDFSWGKSHHLRIDNGKLTIDGADGGKLQPGDQIVVKSSGETFVNGTKR
jgi:hypothetical protein